MDKSRPLHVAVGVVQNQAGEVLISFRDPNLHQGGLWEFPGGKVDQGESVQQALCREFQEELGITPTTFFPFKKIVFQYSDRNVLLDVWRIVEYSGVPTGLEGQPVKWQAAAKLSFSEFPAANKDIVRLLRLPREILITPQSDSLAELLASLENGVADGCSMIYFHQPQLDQNELYQWYLAICELCSETGPRVFCDMDAVPSTHASQLSGLHAQPDDLMGLRQRPCGDDQYFSVSCHSLEQLRKAEAIGADFAILSPQLQDSRWSDAKGLDWSEFKALAAAVSLPIYASGRVRGNDVERALASGGIGVAGTPPRLAD